VEQRRVLLFFTLSAAILMLNAFFLSRPEPPKQIDGGDKQEQAAAPAGEGVGVEAAPEVDADLENDEEDVEQLTDFPESEESPLTFLTLGSVDPDSPYRGLFTFTNHGAGVIRVELTNPRFRDLHDRSGYLGHLELIADKAGGALVQVVGGGTPAAQAGLEVGDRIVSAVEDNKTIDIETPQEFAEILSRRRPRGKFEFSIVRGDAAPQKLEATLGRRPLEVIRPEAENVLMRTKQLPEGFESDPSFLFTLESIGKDSIRAAKGEVPEGEEIDGLKLRNSTWEVAESDDKSITFRKLVPEYRLELIKRYTLSPIPEDEQKNRNYPAYGITLDVEVKNLGNEAVDFAYRLDGPNGLPIEGWWYTRKSGRGWSMAGMRDVVGRYFGSDTSEQSPTKIATGEAKDFEGGSMAFIGVDAQYFAAMMLPNKESIEDVWLETIRPISLSPPPKPRSSDGIFANVTCRLISKTSVLKAGESLKHSYSIFTGPKRPELLAEYKSTADPKYTLSDVLYYGWFGPVAKLMLAILHFFYSIVGNYGIAIIMLTALVRGCVFPLSRKQAHSMAKMQELKPELDKIKEKYGKDPAKQSQAMQELYRKYNINPLAGCLPMFIQLPIFVGLYRALAVDVELRQAPLISDSVRWCSNLAAPDMFWNWSSIMPDVVNSGEGFFGLGPYLNILPLVTIALFILQQQMFMPEPTNEQAALQQKMMKYMSVFIGFMFYKVPSGLCLYFIASSLWGIAERKLVPSPKPGELTPATTNTRPAGKNGSPSTDMFRPKKKR
jgi:YidC/Oxa1 family membrane protein insertase